MKTKTRSPFQKLTPEARLQVRKTAIRMWRHGNSHAEIIFSLQISKNTLERTITAWKKGGQNALAEMDKRQGRGGGARNILTPENEKLILSMIIEQPRDQNECEFTRWRRSSVQQLIEKELGIKLGLTTVGSYLKRWGLTVQRPAKKSAARKSKSMGGRGAHRGEKGSQGQEH